MIERNEPVPLEIDLLRLVARAWRRRWWILAFVIVFGAGFWTVTHFMPRLYRVSTVLVPATPAGAGALGSSLGGSFGALASFAGISLGGDNNRTEEVLAVLKSREFLERFISENKVLPVLFEDDWDAVAGAWKEGRKHSVTGGYGYFLSKVMSIKQEKTTGLIRLNIDWKDGDIASVWANKLVAQINGEMRNRASEQAKRSVEFLEKELSGAPLVATREAIGRVMENQINQRMLANITAEYALRVVDKAMPPEPGAIFSPQVRLIVAAGIILGFTFGLFLALIVPERMRTTSKESVG